MSFGRKATKRQPQAVTRPSVCLDVAIKLHVFFEYLLAILLRNTPALIAYANLDQAISDRLRTDGDHHSDRRVFDTVVYEVLEQALQEIPIGSNCRDRDVTLDSEVPVLRAPPGDAANVVYDNVEIENANLTQIVPTAYHADLVVLLHKGKPVFGIVVEVQLHRDEDKLYTWPLYPIALRAKYHCPACVLVVTPDPGVAGWAARPIELGPGSLFKPLVLGPGAVPWITDAEQARKAPELAVLSVQAHGNEERGLDVVLAALAAASDLDAERAKMYCDLVYLAVNDATRTKLEELMESGAYEYQSEFAKKYVAQGKAEGKAEGLARAVLAVFEARSVAVPVDVRDRVLACEDVESLDRWLKRAVVAAKPSDIFEGK